MKPDLKKAKLDIFSFPSGKDVRTPADVTESYTDAMKSHPFFDNAHTIAELYDSATVKDGKGRIIGVVLRKALPEFAASTAADLLISAAVRSSLRSPMFGGESPLSGIAGYFDYRGSPVELKARKTSFTYEHEKDWPAVFPLVDYVSEIYKCVMPEHWAAQDSAIPDVVRIHGAPFSTLTINSRFRTATHTDAGDFDGGYSCIACIDGNFKGLALTFDDFHMSVLLQPRDVFVFDSHHFHSNTEVEESCPSEDWRRLTCVFYYRSPLGEPGSYAEYQRRLAAALQDKEANLAVKEVLVKPNGENLNRPSPVFPVQPSPFAVVSALHRMHHCAAKALRVHELLLAPSSLLATTLFGEELTCPDGFPLRSLDVKLKANADATQRTAGRFGGFSETGTVLTTAAEKKKYLERAYLSEFIAAELLEMWEKARAKWLDLVAKEWKRLIAIMPERTDFLWKNTSDMNAAFFDLCEVAKQVMLGLLEKETAQRAEEQAFWSMYAVHLNAACTEELGMPPEAMSLRKLNVKLKDFNFGGTRYFKDMPDDEQQRRVERKRRIEEARRRNAASSAGSGERHSTWLTNDSFDYQSEDREVDYAANNWPLPQRHAEDVTKCVHKEDVPASTELVRVLVVHSHPFGKGHGGDGDCKEEVDENVATSAEWLRLMSSPAVHRVLSSTQRNTSLPPECSLDNVKVAFAYHDDLPEEKFDFVVLQHVLSVMPDDAVAATYLRGVGAICSGCIFVAETDVQFRQYYTLQYPIRAAYDAVASTFFQLLHRVAYGTKLARTRTKAEVESLYPLLCCARYKLQGSPMNTVVHILAPE
ncbi:putative DNA J-binding protein [Leptomonas pyrrhocoris]|uniref:Thymine dioxygenase JBP1 n=1 Tax=Leptomonas pyrrhocoris TaxID=157538 RepID=A0A0M9FWV3_LEPPY|nr:putative DNA J-binding protein [Leptomonas pyrrhocoris]XP_015656169.1 putative DNA J-binding protein [Leptomonas pyrrhocoris]KPA77729.1 putative DNA J-binding protein [Leptomonas pyrrhocoris]KPA77730.1 putative DNA J-binding protein [Leptomonas pyrrhocoris]|eukprot:XP_015656168.1 putative DNA J-binding protein [Leptomonas pyrrhocoris]